MSTSFLEMSFSYHRQRQRSVAAEKPSVASNADPSRITRDDTKRREVAANHFPACVNEKAPLFRTAPNREELLFSWRRGIRTRRFNVWHSAPYFTTRPRKRRKRRVRHWLLLSVSGLPRGC